METDKKKRVPILIRIALLFLAAILLSAGITVLISYNYMMDDAALQGKQVAKVAATAAMSAIGSEKEVFRLHASESFREQTHETFRFICKNAGLRYLYLYTIDEKGAKHYIICAAKNDADDVKMNTEYGYGSVQDNPPYHAEMKVLEGDLDGEYEFVDNDYGRVCMYIMPVLDEENQVAALIGADYSIDMIRDIAMDNFRDLLILGMLIFIIANIIALLLIQRSVIRPISALSKRMRSFVRDRETNVRADRRKAMFEDEVTDIEKSFEEMTGDISRYVDDIEKLTEERIQTKTQLDVARKIQCGIIPLEHSVSGGGYEGYGSEQPTREVGGDFFDIFSLDDDRVCVIVGDTSGKGVSAALFMVMTETALRENLKAGCSLSDTLNMVNREICLSNPENMFVTVFAALLDTENGVLKYVNAGHEAPVILRENSSFLKMKSGIPLGLFEDSDIEEEEIQLSSGEGLLIFTDGITEAVNRDKDQYGKDRLMETVSKLQTGSERRYDACKLVRGILQSVTEFVQGAEQFDDITCASLIFRGKNESGEAEAAGMASFESVKTAILTSLGKSAETKKMILACEEIYANIVHYSTADRISFSCDRTENLYIVTFIDNGIPFDPVEAGLPDKDFEDLDTGGMGIRLARGYSKEMVYNRIEGKNILVMKFSLPE